MNQAVTKPTKTAEVVRSWHIIDMKEQNLGRAATTIAELLMGKAKPYFVRNIDCGDYVVVINAKHATVTGKKEEKKQYFRYSGYPGGLTIETLKELRARRPEQVIMHAVKGMLPQNRLRDRMLSRLFVFAEAEHTYEDKFKGKNAKVETTEETK